MKNIRFQTLKILSYREKKAAIIDLDNDAIVVKGRNHTGKSSILKSIYLALGGEIKKMPPGWINANVVLILWFTIDGVKFKSLSMGNDLYLFNPDGSLRFKAKRRSDKLHKKMSELFCLCYRNDELDHTIPVSALYMPFYIDQDTGWGESWSSFSNVGNASDRSNFRQYLTNVVDDMYFQKKAELSHVDSELNRLRTEQKIYQRINLDIQRNYHALNIQLTEADFNRGVESYLKQLTNLREEQHNILRNLQSLFTRKSYLEVNIDQLKRNIKEIDHDFKYALHQGDIITCPTCGGQYKNDMLARHELLKDLSICKDQVIQFEKEYDEIVNRIDVVKQQNADLNTQIANVQSIIKEKKEGVTWEQVIEDRTRTYLTEVVKKSQSESTQAISELVAKKTILEAIIKDFESTGRRDYICSEFVNYVVRAVQSMGGSIKQESVKYAGKITTTGSSLPIHVVAYTAAYLQVIKQFQGPLYMPLVIDEPRQQGLSSKSVNKMLKYLKECLPETTQLILSTTEENVIIPDGYMVINLLDEYSLLEEDKYKEVAEEVDDLLEKDFFQQEY